VWLAAPLTLFFLLFFLMPLGLLAVVSLYTSPEMAAMGPTQYAKFAGDGFNWSVLFATLLLGVKTVALTAVIGYPLALVFTEAHRRLQPILLFVIILPLLTSVVVRTFAWIVILGRDGLVNRVLMDLGLITAPLRRLHTELGLVVALSQIEMPLMLLPLISLMSRLDPNLTDASAALGAGRWRTLFRVIVPLSLPGLLAGCLLVFSWWAQALDSLFMSPLILPALAFGLAALMFFTMLGFRLSLATMILGHVAVITPFILRTTIASLSQLDLAQLDTSASLGAGPLYTFRRVTLPVIRPGILAGAFLAFMASVDNVSVSLFLANPETDVLPIRMWSMLESTLDVRTAAVSGVLIATTALFVFVMDRVAGLTRRLT
jgi:putative spermidine/putrescine transport system permease protein